MMASGLDDDTADKKGLSHIGALAKYCLRIQEQLSYDNIHLMNDFRMSIGLQWVGWVKIWWKLSKNEKNKKIKS